MKRKENVQIISIRLPASLYLAVQRAARRRALDENRTVSAPQIIRELVERERVWEKRMEPRRAGAEFSWSVSGRPEAGGKFAT